MKIVVFSSMAFILFNSCMGFKEKRDALGKTDSSIQSQMESPNLTVHSDSVLTQWINYYKERKPDFSLSGFKLFSTDSLQMMSGHVLGNFDSEFDILYSDFLIYNPVKSLYLDFDSFSWSLDENGNPSFAVDQEINIVDIKNRTVNRIGFNGPSHWVEDGFWLDDSTVVLLQNNYEKRPKVTRVRLKDRKRDTYEYVDTLAFQSEYIQFRFKLKGITK